MAGLSGDEFADLKAAIQAREAARIEALGNLNTAIDESRRMVIVAQDDFRKAWDAADSAWKAAMQKLANARPKS